MSDDQPVDPADDPTPTTDTPTGQEPDAAAAPAPPTDPDARFTWDDVKALRKEAVNRRLQVREREATISLKDAEISSLKVDLRSLKVDLGLARAFGKHGAEPGVTRAFLIDSGAMQRLDPEAQDFAEQIEDAVTETLAQNPALRAGFGPSKSGGQFPGGQPPNQQISRAELAGMDPDEVNRAREAGLLDNLLGRLR